MATDTESTGTSKVHEHLTSMTRDELNVLAKKLRISKFRKLTRAELIAVVEKEDATRLTGLLFPSWWTRFHNHVYFLISVVLAFGLFIAEHQFSSDSRSPGSNPIGQFPVSVGKHIESATIAVLYFENHSSDMSEYDVLAKAMCSMMISYLSEAKQFNIVERVRLQDVLDELELSNTREFDKSTIAKVGKLLGAQRLVLGSYLVFNGTLRIDARMVDVETGVTIVAAGENGVPEKFSDVLLGVSKKLVKAGAEDSVTPDWNLLANSNISASTMKNIGETIEQFDTGNKKAAVDRLVEIHEESGEPLVITMLLNSFQKALNE